MKQKDLLFILISLSFIVAVWIAFSILHTSLTSTLSAQTVTNAQPIPATFDTKTLALLKKRTNVNPQNSIPITPSVTPTLAPITPVSSLQTIQLATQSGTASEGGTNK